MDIAYLNENYALVRAKTDIAPEPYDVDKVIAYAARIKKERDMIAFMKFIPDSFFKEYLKPIRSPNTLKGLKPVTANTSTLKALLERRFPDIVYLDEGILEKLLTTGGTAAETENDTKQMFLLIEESVIEKLALETKLLLILAAWANKEFGAKDAYGKLITSNKNTDLTLDAITTSDKAGKHFLVKVNALIEESDKTGITKTPTGLLYKNGSFQSPERAIQLIVYYRRIIDSAVARSIGICSYCGCPIIRNRSRGNTAQYCNASCKTMAARTRTHGKLYS